MTDVVRVWGKADTFDIEFTYDAGTLWHCSVPADLEDGVYACEIHALDSAGQHALWTGELYMVNGICHLSLCFDRFRFAFSKNGIELIIKKGCGHGL